MEGEREKSPINTEQQEENIDSVPSDGQETSRQPSSSATSALSSKPESPGKHTDSSERALSDNIGMQLCPDCNIELDPNVHRFCYRCGKTIQEIVLFNAREEDNNGIQLCPNCNIELDTNVHMFCYKCGKKVQEMVSNVQEKQDTTLSHTPVPECDSSEQISNSGIDVASNSKEVKPPVIVETTVAETQGSQQVTAVTGQMPWSKVKSQAANVNELNESDAGHTVSGSAEQTSNRVIVVENEIDTESVLTDDQNSIGKGHEGVETGSMDIDSTVQVPNKSLILNNPDFSHDKDVSGVSQISNSGSEQQVVVGDRESAVGEAVGKGFKRLTAVSKKTYANETKSLEEATWQGGNRNQLIVSDAGHPISGSPEQVSDHVIFIANEFGEITVAQETAVVEPLTGSVQKSHASPEKMTVGDQNSIGNSKGNEVGETDSTDIDRQIPKKDLIPNNDPNLPRYDDNVNGRSSNEISDINHGECAGKLTNNTDPGTKEHQPSSQKLTEVVDKFDEFAEGILTAGKRNVDHEQRTPELVQHSEQKKDSEKGKSEEKGGKYELKIENDVTRNNSGISDANGRSKVDKMVGGNLKTTTAGNRQQIAKDDKDQTVTSNKSETNKDNVSSDMRRSTRSMKPQQPGGVQDRVSQKDETLLEKAKQASNDPLSHGNETATPADEGNGGGYFYKKAEVTQEQGKKSKKKGKGKDDKHPTDNVDEQSLTVVFHAILSDKFKLEEGMNIVIRGDSPVFDGWNKGGVDVTTQYVDGHLLVHGQFNVPLRLVHRKCGYKYVLLNKKKKPIYEELVEYQSWRGIANRCLVMEREYITENKIFHKYDGFIYPKPGTMSWDRFFPSGSAMNDRRAFFRKFFPKWSGFYVNSFDDKIQPVQALQNLEYLVEGISAVWTSTSGYSYRRTVDSYNLKLGEVGATSN